MKLKLTKFVLAACFMPMTLSAHAEMAGESADELLKDSDTAFQLLDAGQFAQLWLNSASFVRDRLNKDQFITDMQRARQGVGVVQHRGWASVTRVRYSSSAELPDGLYATVDYATTKAGGGTVYEKLSFRLEPDGRWHFTGYIPRGTQEVRPEIAK